MPKKIVFMTGTRADYGKLKPLISVIEASPLFESHIYVSGMHLLEKYGRTISEIYRDGLQNIFPAIGQFHTDSMSFNLSNVIANFTGYVDYIKPDMVVVHGDRIEALAGAITGALNNICVAHIEGGEITGTIDESIRHAVSKFTHLHFVANEDAKKNLVQMGENEFDIHVIGSPDIDVMLSSALPSINDVKKRYEIGFENYSILMYHPVTTERAQIKEHAQQVVDAVVRSGKNYVVIYPNNDSGSDDILNLVMPLGDEARFRLLPSLRFEFFLSLLKESEFIIGNSSAGIREACVYGIPSIDIGTRQSGRYDIEELRNIQHVREDGVEIANAINRVGDHRIKVSAFGDGNSAQRFLEVLSEESTWRGNLQKRFIVL